MYPFIQGRDGVPGAQGPAGSDGAAGANGDVGASGPEGPPVSTQVERAGKYLDYLC